MHIVMIYFIDLKVEIKTQMPKFKLYYSDYFIKILFCAKLKCLKWSYGCTCLYVAYLGAIVLQDPNIYEIHVHLYFY